MQTNRLSRLAALAVALALSVSACGLTPTQKKWTAVAAGVLIIGAVAAHQQDHGDGAGAALTDPTLPCHPQPDGTCR